MLVKHAKVSGLPNPEDTTKIGGADWDEDHVVTGFRLLGRFRVDRTADNVVTVSEVMGIASPEIWASAAGELAIKIPEIGSAAWDNRIVVDVPDRYNRTTQKLQVFEVIGPIAPTGFKIKIYLINTTNNTSNNFGWEFWGIVNVYEVVG